MGSLQMLLGAGVATSAILLGAAEDTRIGLGILLVIAIAGFITTIFLIDDPDDK